MDLLNNKYLKAINLQVNDIQIFRKNLKNYFINSYEIYEEIFSVLKNKQYLYLRPNPLRHPLIFYYGHTATFFINKLLMTNLLDTRVNSNFESIFSIGVDEMKWDSINNSSYEWPNIDDVIKYRNDVKNVVIEIIDNIDIVFPINWNSPVWIVLMGIEHEKIHFETSSVLLRELDIKFINSSDRFKPYSSDDDKIQNTLVPVKGGKIEIAYDKDNPIHYGWDNEYGYHSNHINDFMVSKYLVSNYEFLEFVESGSYENNDFYLDEALEWKLKANQKMPFYWSKKNGEYYLRHIAHIVNLPLSHPVEVNYYEAEAFINWKNKNENLSLSLPSEDEYIKMRQYTKADECISNTNLKHLSSTPVNKYNFNGIYDVIGNVWQWSKSMMYPYEGFVSHKIYEDFTSPTFDDKHALIKGGSFISTGNEAVQGSRYAFRKHFLQHSGFRYVSSTNKEKRMSNIYENDETISQYCEFHYGEKYFNVDNFCKKTIENIKPFIKETKKALDLGCSVGRSSFEMAKIYDDVLGVDFSSNFIKVAINLKDNENISFSITKEADIKESKEVSLKSLNLETNNIINFAQGDACNLKQEYNNYDLIVCNNLIDRLYSPIKFLNDIEKRINKDGILSIASPYTWLEEFTKKEQWLGGKVEHGKSIHTIDILKKHLEPNFTLVDIKDVEFVIRETSRKFQHSISQMSIWRKK